MLQIKGYGLKLLKTSLSIFSCDTQFKSSWDLCSFGDVTQCRMIGPCQRFRTNYKSHLQGPITSWTALPLNLGPTGCLKMSVWNYQSLMHKISNEHRSTVHHRGSLKSIFLWWTLTQLSMFTPPFW